LSKRNITHGFVTYPDTDRKPFLTKTATKIYICQLQKQQVPNFFRQKSEMTFSVYGSVANVNTNVLNVYIIMLGDNMQQKMAPTLLNLRFFRKNKALF